MSVWVSSFGFGFRISSFLCASACLVSVFVLNQAPVYLAPFTMKSYLHPFPIMKYSLIEILLVWKYKRSPELPAAQYLPVFVNPTFTFPEHLGDLLNCHYDRLSIYFKTLFAHNSL